MNAAVIFDMDGVLADSQGLHARCERAVLFRYGIELSEAEISRQYGGTTDREFFTAVLSKHGLSIEYQPLIRAKWQAMLALAPNIQPIPGASDLVSALRTLGVKLAVASGSPLDFIESTLRACAMRGAFDAVASGEEVRQGKPAPEVFLLAAERLHVSPEQCVVIEDSLSGILAARRAGMKCVAVSHTGEVGMHAADRVVSDLRHVTADAILTL